jgi:Ca2+-binding RTX toxin-like protein
MAYSATGTAGNDTLNQSTDAGPGSIVGLAGDDSILTGSGAVTVDGGSGEDTVLPQTGNTGMVSGGTENDSIWDTDTDIGSMILFGNQGGDTISVLYTTSAQTILGGNDSADGNDSLRSGSGADIIFGHGGDDHLAAGGGNDTYVAGIGNDFLYDAIDSNLAFGNEGNDTISIFLGNNTVFAGRMATMPMAAARSSRSPMSISTRTGSGSC